MPGKNSSPSNYKEKSIKSALHLLQGSEGKNLFQLFRPGAFVRLENHPIDLPPFQLISCRGGRCLVRQQTWGKYIHWEVEHHRLESA